MLNSKTARFIIAILAAVLLWAYVVGEVNPSKTKTIRNIPITYTYEETLNERGLAIGGAADEYINLEVSGARAILGDITPNDISATINVASAQKGDNEMSISIRVPSGITVNKQSTGRTTVTVENLIQKPVNIEVMYTGNFLPGEQGVTVNMSSSQVLVSGAESLIESIVNARGVVDASNVSDTLSAISCQLEAVDSEGRVVDGVRLSQRSISVSSIIARNKTVELVVPIVNTATDRMVRDVSVPETIVIFGAADTLANMESVTASSVDVSQIKEDSEIDLKFNFTNGVRLAEGQELKAMVTVQPIEDKVFTFAPDAISIVGAQDGFDYKIADGTEVSVKASDIKSVLDALSQNAIKVSVDVAKLKTSGTAEVKMECSAEVLELKLETKSISIEMTSKTLEGESNSENNNENNNNNNNGN